jgi:hypothetical protein
MQDDVVKDVEMSCEGAPLVVRRHVDAHEPIRPGQGQEPEERERAHLDLTSEGCLAIRPAHASVQLKMAPRSVEMKRALEQGWGGAVV